MLNIQQMDFPGGSEVRNPSGNAGDMYWEDLLEKGMATHSSISAWETSLIEESGKLQFTESQKSPTQLSNKTTTNN